MFHLRIDRNPGFLYILPTLRIELSQIIEEPTSLEVSFAPSEARGLFEELRLTAPLMVRVLVTPEGRDKWFLSGTLSGVQKLICARTTEPFDRPFEEQITLSVVRTQSVVRQELDDDGAEIFNYRIPMNQTGVDVTECVRELVILQEPICPVKDPDRDFEWKNEEVVLSPEEDPRWEKLKALKQKMENTENPSSGT